MTENAVVKNEHLGTDLPHWGSNKKAMARTVTDFVGTARRVVKRGRFAVEDLMDEAAHTVKQRPLQIVVFTFGLALGAGALFGWIASRTQGK
jgi:hypothetical protein